MKIHRFYSHSETSNKSIGDMVEILDIGQIKQIQNVLRLESGDEIIIFSNNLDFLCTITDIRKSKIILTIKDLKKVSKPSISIHVFMSFIKKDLLEESINKLVQLGISEFTPIISDRTENKNTHLNLERVHKIAIEALEQSGRADMVKINHPIKLNQINFNTKDYIDACNIICDISGEEWGTNLNLWHRNKKYNLFFGPEGGWTDNEMLAFNELANQSSQPETPINTPTKQQNEKNFHIIKLGEYTMRAETAVVAGVAKII